MDSIDGNKSVITTDAIKGKGGVYAIIGGVVWYYVHEDYPIDY